MIWHDRQSAQKLSDFVLSVSCKLKHGLLCIKNAIDWGIVVVFVLLSFFAIVYLIIKKDR